MQGPKLSDKLYVKSVSNNDGGFLEANSDPKELGEFNRTVKVGVYKRIDILDLTNQTSVQ